MTVTKLSVSLDEDLARLVRERAGRTGQTVSGLIGELLGQGLRQAALTDALDTWEAENGVITAEMMREVQQRHPTRWYGGDATDQDALDRTG